MAYFDEKTGEIVLSEDDKEMFKDIQSNFSPKGIRTSWAKSIIDWLWEDIGHE